MTRIQTISAQKLEDLRASLPEEFHWAVTPDSEADHILCHAAEHASQSGVKVKTHVARGNAAKAILKTAQDVHADVVVVGNRRIERRIRRSVPRGVSQGADRAARAAGRQGQGHQGQGDQAKLAQHPTAPRDRPDRAAATWPPPSCSG